MSVLKSTKSFYKYDASDILAYNIQQRLIYGLSELGAYTNIAYSGSYGTLERSNAKVFEGVGGGWVWESGISSLQSPNPSPVSGIYYNNTFFNTGSTITSGAYTSSWFVDYRHGRVVFASGTPNGTAVKCNYSARDIAVYLSDDNEFKTIMTEFSNRYSSLDTLQPSGMASYLKQNRVWLPCIVVNVASADADGYQLGGGENQNFNVLFHVFSDTPSSARKISDLLRNQFQTTIDLFDPNNAPFPLKYNGSLTGSGIEYDDLGSRNSPYFWSYARVQEVDGGDFQSDLDDNLYRAECRWLVEVNRGVGTY